MKISDGKIEFNGDVYFKGDVSLFGTPEFWGNGCVGDDYFVTWDIPQDGFILFHNEAGLKALVTSADGSTILFDHRNDCIGTVLLPVRNGDTVRIADCDYGVWWFPMGGVSN